LKHNAGKRPLPRKKETVGSIPSKNGKDNRRKTDRRTQLGDRIEPEMGERVSQGRYCGGNRDRWGHLEAGLRIREGVGSFLEQKRAGSEEEKLQRNGKKKKMIL